MVGLRQPLRRTGLDAMVGMGAHRRRRPGGAGRAPCLGAAGGRPLRLLPPAALRRPAVSGLRDDASFRPSRQGGVVRCRPRSSAGPRARRRAGLGVGGLGVRLGGPVATFKECRHGRRKRRRPTFQECRHGRRKRRRPSQPLPRAFQAGSCGARAPGGNGGGVARARGDRHAALVRARGDRSGAPEAPAAGYCPTPAPPRYS
jgi:hypothetical protein